MVYYHHVLLLEFCIIYKIRGFVLNYSKLKKIVLDLHRRMQTINMRHAHDEKSAFNFRLNADKTDESHPGANNSGFRSSVSAEASHLHTVIVRHVRRADSEPSLANDELHPFYDEGHDSDVDDLSQLDSGDERDWEQREICNSYV